MITLKRHAGPAFYHPPPMLEVLIKVGLLGLSAYMVHILAQWAG